MTSERSAPLTRARELGAGIVLRVLRRCSPRWRAWTDLFVEPFRSRVGWASGLGPSGLTLYAVTRQVRPSVIVEIGSARGYSTCCLALGCLDNGSGTVHAIDPHDANPWTDTGTGGDTLAFLNGRLDRYRLRPHCRVLAMTSAAALTAWDRPVDLLFIDGDHSEDGVRRDYEGFLPWVRPNGLIVFHDTAWEHHRPWTDYRDKPWFRPGMGVPAFLDHLRRAGLHGVTFPAVPGLTIMHPAPGGFDFLAARRASGPAADREASEPC